MSSYSQDISSDSIVIIHSLRIEGNEKTRNEILLRELDFREGDIIKASEFEKMKKKAENRIFNTGLFIMSEILTEKKENKRVDIVIKVKERWYTYPIPLLELADRNFNEWWEQRGRNFNRLNYGLFLVQKNVRGRNETLKLKLQGGFTKKAEAFYHIPYFLSNYKAGLQISFSYIFSQQVPYGLGDHQLLYAEGINNLIERLYSGAQYTYRNKLYTWHSAELLFHQQSVADTVTQLNPDFLGNAENKRRFLSFSYTFLVDKRDIQYYALNGYLFKADLLKTGLGILGDLNLISLRAEVDIYKPLFKRSFLASGLTLKTSFPKTQPFYFTRGLGYESDFVRGYELYVINGQHFMLWKTSLRYQIFSTTKEIRKIPVKQFSTLPVALYLSGNFDLGYVIDNKEQTSVKSLANTFLPGGGIGLDLVTFYDLVIRTEYSWNKLGESGLFFHFIGAIGGRKKF